MSCCFIIATHKSFQKLIFSGKRKEDALKLPYELRNWIALSWIVKKKNSFGE